MRASQCCCLLLLVAVAVSAAGPLLLLPAMVVLLLPLLLLLPYSPTIHHFYACIEIFVLATFANRHSCQTGVRVLALHCRVQ